MPPGRPRGSGREKSIPSIPLLAPEWPVFQAGYEAAPRAPRTWADKDPSLAELSAILSPFNRRRVVTYDDDFAACWLMIGIMFWHLEKAVDAARGL